MIKCAYCSTVSKDAVQCPACGADRIDPSNTIISYLPPEMYDKLVEERHYDRRFVGGGKLSYRSADGRLYVFEVINVNS